MSSTHKLNLPFDQNALVAILHNHGVTQASVFGSFARGDFTESSDLDLLVQFSEPVSLFEQISLQQDLESATKRRVDVVTRLHPVFEPYITADLVPLPL
jgi:predicted nucleotidyltransferase